MTGLPDLYVVLTDPVAGYARCAEAAVSARVRRLQLRMKDAPRSEILSVARLLRGITRGSDTQFLVNDDPDLAAEVGADGVHVGQEDIRPDPSRWHAAGLRTWGLSTHNETQAQLAAALAPDYIGIGPIFATPTKRKPDPVVGTERLCRIIARSSVPVVAIGGIDATNLRAVLRTGAREFAVVRAVGQARDPGAAIRRLQEIAAVTV